MRVWSSSSSALPVSAGRGGCFHNLGALVVGVLVARALSLLGVYVRPSIFENSQVGTPAQVVAAVSLDFQCFLMFEA